MEKFPKFVKKVAKLGAMGSIAVGSFFPHESNAQSNFENNPKNKIEVSENISDKIFDEVELGFKQGLLKVAEGYFRLFYLIDENADYDIRYDLDANNDNKEDASPKIKIEHTEGNITFLLVKDPTSDSDKDLAFDYKDEELSGAEIDTYENFFNKYHIVITSLYGDKQHKIRFRQINNDEKNKILNDIKILLKKNKELKSKNKTQ